MSSLGDFVSWVTPLENAGLVSFTVPPTGDGDSITWRFFPVEARLLANRLLEAATWVEEL